MSSRHNRSRKLEDRALFHLNDSTRHHILGVIFSGLAIFFILAWVDVAGPAGHFISRWLDRLFGIGFFLAPLASGLLALAFFKSIKPRFVIGRLIAVGCFIFSILGLFSLFLGGSKGGWVGDFLSRPVERIFDVYAGGLILFLFAVVSLLALFDSSIRLSMPSWLTWRKKSIVGVNAGITLLPEEAKKLTGAASNDASEVAADRTLDLDDKEAVLTKQKSADSASWPEIFGSRKRRAIGKFASPPLDLLSGDSGKPGVGDIKANANIIKRTLANFGIQVEMDEVSIGPSVTRYSLKPAEGVKLSRILGLHNDLALALAAHPIRIEAPIPGRSLVGIEIPNSAKTIVGLGTLIGSAAFTESADDLVIAIGRDISGLPHFANLSKAPHVLVAGATGSGKSVVIHTFITSLLYRNPPSNLRFILIDPKRVELTLYRHIPHLLTPVITTPQKAIMALRWASKEMDRRYDILEREAARDIHSYHKNVFQPAIAKQGAKETSDDGPEEMPFVVIIIDELADIMSTYPRELESAIVRLAQMSRAVGIHLILSTQRPSVEVITGLIKANIPTRVALQVTSQIDSRTILDGSGAEKLLGSGDMLYLNSEKAKPVRLQGAFISENEVKKVVSYLADQNRGETPDMLELDAPAADASGKDFSDDENEIDDDLYEDARETVLGAGKASASFLQRKFRIGYARAARLLDLLEERGVIGPGEGAKPRQVYREGFDQSSDKSETP